MRRLMAMLVLGVFCCCLFASPVLSDPPTDYGSPPPPLPDGPEGEGGDDSGDESGWGVPKSNPEYDEKSSAKYSYFSILRYGLIYECAFNHLFQSFEWFHNRIDMR